MKMEKGILLCCFSLWLLLVSVTASKKDIPKPPKSPALVLISEWGDISEQEDNPEHEDIPELEDISDLKTRTHFGKQFPRHGLQLMHWFANNININQNGRISFNVQLNPNRGDFGYHYYGNRPITFPEERNTVFYSLGNLNSRTGLPHYVTQDFYNSEGGSLRNIDRIVIRMNRNNQQNVQEVFITQHFVDRNRGSWYDRSNTFRVRPSLLRQIQDISRRGGITRDYLNQHNLITNNNNDEYERGVYNLQRVYPETPGLAEFMTLSGYDVDGRVSLFSRLLHCATNSRRGKRSTTISQSCEANNNIKLVVKSTSNGYAKITWSGVPENIVKMNGNVGLYKDQELTVHSLNGRTYGDIDTSTALNSGLQLKLTIDKEVIWVGPEFHEANGVLPTKIEGYDASLQLYTKGGYAGARLIIKKTFSDWKTVFVNSWVGFYTSSKDDNDQYRTWQWSTKFEANSDHDFPEDYNVFDYTSGEAIGPGMQLRFLLDKWYNEEKARTEPWDRVINPKSVIHDELKKK